MTDFSAILGHKLPPSNFSSPRASNDRFFRDLKVYRTLRLRLFQRNSSGPLLYSILRPGKGVQIFFYCTSANHFIGVPRASSPRATICGEARVRKNLIAQLYLVVWYFMLRWEAKKKSLIKWNARLCLEKWHKKFYGHLFSICEIHNILFVTDTIHSLNSYLYRGKSAL